MNWYNKANLKKISYGGPAFSPERYVDDFLQNNFLNYKQLYDDVQMEIDNMVKNSRDVVWFSDVLDPFEYKSDLTVESCWQEDKNSGIDYLKSIDEWITEHYHEEPTDPNEFAKIDQSTPKCIEKYFYTFGFENMPYDEYDLRWGPYKWTPDLMGEWMRCRNIALFDYEDAPVAVYYDGQVLDGAHRLAVAMYKRRGGYPCLVGIPIEIMESISRPEIEDDFEEENLS